MGSGLFYNEFYIMLYNGRVIENYGQLRSGSKKDYE